ncbi:hypothetical protein JW766_06810 [Candidatus Dojkabacteria bacterium]|nr:hypothetical protein [Candidatus Dojkabacteria bacterium]
MKAQNPRLAELFKTPQRKTYTLVGITTITVGLFIFATLRPTFIKIADLNKEIKDQEKFLAKIDKKLETVNYLINQKNLSQKELVYFDEDFPTEGKGGFLVANLAALADNNDVALMSVEFKEVDEQEIVEITESESINILEVNMSIYGTLDNLEEYVEDLEIFPRIFDIRSVSYSRTELSRSMQSQGNYQEEFRPIECGVTMYVFNWGGESEAEE